MNGFRLAVILIGMALVAGAGSGLRSSRAMAGEPPGKANEGSALRQGPLAGLPSQPGAHLEKIRALGDNQWLNLGSPAADPKWGKACGRSWSPLAPYASDLRGAFFFGEGIHGHVKEDGRYMDDLWFYDVNGHRWICVYPGIDPLLFGTNNAKAIALRNCYFS